MRLFRSAASSASVVLLGCLAVSGCSTDVAFRVDDRLSFTSPQDRAVVTLPVRLSWNVRDFTVLREPAGAPPRASAGYFGVFVDRAPVPPGKPLRYLARDDKRCREADGCPDPEYLAGLGVFTTTKTELVIPRLPHDTSHPDRRERHRAVVVLLDSAGKRIGESAFETVFDVQRRTP